MARDKADQQQLDIEISRVATKSENNRKLDRDEFDTIYRDLQKNIEDLVSKLLALVRLTI